MPHVYTAEVAVRHDELDAFGRVYPTAYLRYLAQLAVDASTDAGFGPAWYEDAGLMWLVRRTGLEIERPVGRGARLQLATWVEDFRRVRSHRAYEATGEAGEQVLRGRTDWVLIDVVTGRPARVPAEVEAAFGVPSGAAALQRAPWQAPPPPDAPARRQHEIRFTDLDALAHVNNATYVDLLIDAALAMLAGAGWPVPRFRETGVAPWMCGLEVEYLDAALHGDVLVSTSWLASEGDDIVVHQLLAREGGAPLLRARTEWAWHTLDGLVPVRPPRGLAAALAPLRAA